ncbi:hypothetical protein KCP70_23845 [Salmonella enterica subsp. enterica]|nr:hypothetical protein KCP70_23845 [Salmonella enterica subsp. enterica]
MKCLSGLLLNDRVGSIRVCRHPARKPDGDARLIYRVSALMVMLLPRSRH